MCVSVQHEVLHSKLTNSLPSTFSKQANTARKEPMIGMKQKVALAGPSTEKMPNNRFPQQQFKSFRIFPSSSMSMYANIMLTTTSQMIRNSQNVLKGKMSQPVRENAEDTCRYIYIT